MQVRMSHFRAQPGKEENVREALRELATTAIEADPPTRFYSIYESLDEPGLFVVSDEQDDAGEVSEDEELLRLGTALRESMLEPIKIGAYRLVSDGA